MPDAPLQLTAAHLAQPRATPVPRAASAPSSFVVGAPPARPRRHHWLIIASCFLAVVFPTLMAATYLTWTAADRYGSRVAFSIRSNQSAAPLEILRFVTQLGISSVLTDGQVLYEFIQSQQIVETVRTKLPLEATITALRWIGYSRSATISRSRNWSNTGTGSWMYRLTRSPAS